MPRPDLIQRTKDGFFCPRGGFHIDPWRPVDRAVVTHGHADHARPGSKAYLAAASGLGVLRRRLGADARLEGLAYGVTQRIGDVTVSFHPAGHVLGSAQVLVEADGERWIVTGDYKTEPDTTCAPFESVMCDVLVTECTFGLPIYRWPDPEQTRADIHAWWRGNQDRGRTSVLYAYALGKAQRLLSWLDPDVGPIFAHGAVRGLLDAYTEAGIELPQVLSPTKERVRAARGRGIVLAPPSAAGNPWIRRFGPFSDAMASGWALVRGARRQRSVDRGFVVSDHADWDGLTRVIRASGASRLGVTHGFLEPFGRWWREQGLDVVTYRTEYRSEDSDTAPGPGSDADADDEPNGDAP